MNPKNETAIYANTLNCSILIIPLHSGLCRQCHVRCVSSVLSLPSTAVLGISSKYGTHLSLARIHIS